MVMILVKRIITVTLFKETYLDVCAICNVCVHLVVVVIVVIVVPENTHSILLQKFMKNFSLIKSYLVSDKDENSCCCYCC